MNFVWSQHALEQIIERKISKDSIEQILSNPLQKTTENGKSIYHGLSMEGDKPYLIRIFVNTDVDPNMITTVYKTSKIRKYYEGEIR